MYDKLVAKLNNIDTSGFVLKTKYKTDKAELEKNISDVTDLVEKNFHDKLRSSNQKINSNKIKHLAVENWFTKLKTFDSSHFIGKSHFEEDYLVHKVFQPMYRYFKRVRGVGSGNHIYFWRYKGLFDENITAPTTSDYKLNKLRGEFNGSCFKQNKIIYDHGKVVNICVVYEISKNINISDYSTLGNCLFRAVTLAKNADVDQYNYSGCEIRFDWHGLFSHPSGGTGRNVIIFKVDCSSSKIDNKKKDIWIWVKGPTKGLEHTLCAKKMYSINFTDHNKNFCLNLHYNGANRHFFVNIKKNHQFKAKDFEIVATL